MQGERCKKVNDRWHNTNKKQKTKVRLHYRKEINKNLFGRAKVKASHNEAVRFSLISGELLATINQVEHPQFAVKPKLVGAMLPFDLTIVLWRRYADTVVQDAHIFQSLLKQGFVLGLDNEQSVGELRTVVRLYFPDREKWIWNQLHQEVFVSDK